MSVNAWRAEEHYRFWYCVRDHYRVGDAFLCKGESEARATADALNMIDAGRYVTVALTEATNMLYIPRSDGT